MEVEILALDQRLDLRMSVNGGWNAHLDVVEHVPSGSE